MDFILDLRPIGHGEAQLAKGPDDGVGDLGERMQATQRTATARRGEVSRLLGQGRLEFQNAADLGQHGFQLLFGRIDRLAGQGTFFLRQGAQLLHECRERALGSEEAALGPVQGCEIRRGPKFLLRGGEDGGKAFLQGHGRKSVRRRGQRRSNPLE